MSNAMDDLKSLIIHKLDIIEFLDIIGYDIHDLVDKLESEIEDYNEELLEACR